MVAFAIWCRRSSTASTVAPPADVQAVVTFYQKTLGNLAGATPGPASAAAAGQGPLSWALFYHIALSDKWGYSGDPSLAALEAQLDTLTTSTGLSVNIAKRQDAWPRYPHDEFVGKFPSYSGPLLMLQGGLDPATPHKYAVKLKDLYNGPQQHWVSFDQMTHDPGRWSPLSDGSHCGHTVYSDFLENPTQLDTSCVSSVLPVLFSGSPSLNTALLGSASAWD